MPPACGRIEPCSAARLSRDPQASTHRAADPEDIANHNLLGFCCYKQRRHDKAVECFREAVRIDPRSAIDWANLGSNLRDLGRVAEAVAAYEKALALDGALAFARTNLRALEERLASAGSGDTLDD